MYFLHRQDSRCSFGTVPPGQPLAPSAGTPGLVLPSLGWGTGTPGLWSTVWALQGCKIPSHSEPGDFPSGAGDRNLPASAGDNGLDLRSGRIPRAAEHRSPRASAAEPVRGSPCFRGETAALRSPCAATRGQPPPPAPGEKAPAATEPQINASEPGGAVLPPAPLLRRVPAVWLGARRLGKDKPQVAAPGPRLGAARPPAPLTRMSSVSGRPCASQTFQHCR